MGFFINKRMGEIKENHIRHSFTQKYDVTKLGKASKINKIPML
jgi:hypothetical protein